MKTFYAVSKTNYGIMVHIINAKSKIEVTNIALNKGAWDYCEITEINITKKGCVFIVHLTGG